MSIKIYFVTYLFAIEHVEFFIFWTSIPSQVSGLCFLPFSDCTEAGEWIEKKWQIIHSGNTIRPREDDILSFAAWLSPGSLC